MFVNDQLKKIKDELKLTRQELVDRLSKSRMEMEASVENVFSSVSNLYDREKDAIMNQNVRKELDDVNRALLKMELGLFGFCEHSGEIIPMDQLSVLPTARTKNEAAIMDMFY
jgi:RNA polymerase-binding transcription factor DksA